MKQIKVIGIGMGDEASMTVAARNWIRGCDLFIGASRMVQTATAIADNAGKECVIAWQPKEVCDAIRQSGAKKIAVLMSGDIGFFSGARALREELEKSIPDGIGEDDEADASVRCAREKDTPVKLACGRDADGKNVCEYELTWLPGVSSMAYFCDAVGISYEDAYTVSIHGRSIPYIRQVAIHKKTFLLTDGNLPELGQDLLKCGLGGVTVWVGMDLAAPAQRIFKMTPEELSRFPKEDRSPLTVCLILNPDAERWRDPYRRDEEFCRDGKTPMTKEEVRGILLGKLRPENGDIIWDIGGGSGSVSVACAIAASGGIVYSVERDPDAVRLMDENRRRFACDNIEIVAGSAPEALRGLPAPDRVFIGGSGGELAEILREIENRIALPETGTEKKAMLFKSSGQREDSGEMGESCEEAAGNAGKGKNIRVVISSVTLETTAAVSSYIQTSPYVKDAEVCQLAISKSKKIGGSTLMMGQNPVMIFSFDLVNG